MKRHNPWITFTLNLERATYNLWMLLGEAQSKCEHLAGTPLLPRVARKFQEVFLAKGALATTAIEGNTLTEEEALKRVQGQLELPISKEYLGQEIDNIVSACSNVSKSLLETTTPLSIEEILNFNKKVLEKIPLKEDVEPGKIRQHNVGVAGYRGAPPEDCSFLLQRNV